MYSVNKLFIFYIELLYSSHSTLCSTFVAILLLVSGSSKIGGLQFLIDNYICTCAGWIYTVVFFREHLFSHFGSKFVQVDGMDALAVKQACKFAKEFALKNGPIVSKFTSYLCLYFLNLCLAFRNDSFILLYVIAAFSNFIILSRFLKWTHTDTMATPCLIQAAPTALVMKFLVWDRYITMTMIICLIILIVLRSLLSLSFIYSCHLIIGAWSNWKSKKAAIGSWDFYRKGTKGDWMKFVLKLHTSILNVMCLFCIKYSCSLAFILIYVVHFLWALWYFTFQVHETVFFIVLQVI